MAFAAVLLTLAMQGSAIAQPPWNYDSLRVAVERDPKRPEQVDTILRIESSSQLLDALNALVHNEQLWMLGESDLPGTSLALSGWRWEGVGYKDQHIVLAIEGSRTIAMVESKYRGVQLSISHYDFELQKTVQHEVSAMSAKHLAQKSPELFKIYFRYTGPTREIFDSRKLPKPAWQTW